MSLLSSLSREADLISLPQVPPALCTNKCRWTLASVPTSPLLLFVCLLAILINLRRQRSPARCTPPPVVYGPQGVRGKLLLPLSRCFNSCARACMLISTSSGGADFAHFQQGHWLHGLGRVTSVIHHCTPWLIADSHHHHFGVSACVCTQNSAVKGSLCIT